MAPAPKDLTTLFKIDGESLNYDLSLIQTAEVRVLLASQIQVRHSPGLSVPELTFILYPGKGWKTSGTNGRRAMAVQAI